MRQTLSRTLLQQVPRWRPGLPATVVSVSPASPRPDPVRRVHLDSASGPPTHPRAREVWDAAVADGWADPLRLHSEGRAARALLDNAREAVATVLSCRPDELSFTSSGTLACHTAVLGLRRGRARAATRVVHSAVEHSAVLAACRWPVGDGADATEVGVDLAGQVDLDAWRREVGAGDVAVACLQQANHEVGTTQPLAEAAAAAAAAGVPLVVDAAAAIGWTSPPAHGDAVVASARKWGGPPGVGMLVVRKGARWRPPWPADEREWGQPGFADVPGALAAAASLQVVEIDRVDADARMRRLTDELRRALVARIPDVDVAGHAEQRLPHIVNFSCLYLDGEALVTELDRRGFATSSGSACAATAGVPSHVLAAMGVLTHGNVRVSIAPATTEAEVAAFVDAAADAVSGLRAGSAATPPDADRAP